MLGSSEVIAFVSSTDLVRSRQFYEGVLGLRVDEVNDYACVFYANGTMVRVTAVSEVAQPGYTVLGWRVSDLAAAASGLAGHGVELIHYPEMAAQDGLGVWTTPGGDKVAWFHDPDGNVLSLTQFR